MRAVSSLRARLVLLTTLAVAVVWLITAAFTWRAALHEIEELLNHPPATASHLQKERAELAGEIAEHLLMPMLIALPGLALVLVAAVGFSLRPLRRLTDDIAARAPDRLTPIANVAAPSEILPLIERLNALFGEIDRALENERRFTADASHELRTPLAALKAQAQVALAATDDGERRHALTQILAGCDRATHLVTQMLTLARLDANRGHTLHGLALRPLVSDVLADSAGDAVAADCELVLGEGDAWVRGDTALLQSMLRNLVENALRHGHARHIEIDIAREEGEAILTVADDGCGIPPDEREQVMQRFNRGASAGGSGSGLGLSIVQRVIDLHCGTLQLSEGIAGRGLVVRARIPLATKT